MVRFAALVLAFAMGGCAPSIDRINRVAPVNRYCEDAPFAGIPVSMSRGGAGKGSRPFRLIE